MERVDIRVRKNKKGEFVDGEFYVKELDVDEIFSLQGSPDDKLENSRLLQKCLVTSEGEPVFKPQQINLIKERLSGVDFTVALIAANGINDFGKIGATVDKYSKNSKSDQS